MEISWYSKSFTELTTVELYDLLRLRSEVFVVEQTCIFLDIDNNDQKSVHCVGVTSDTKEIVAYSRIFDRDLMYPGHLCIGRVITSPRHRKLGLGKKLLEFSISECRRIFGEGSIKIGAQSYLKKFYSSFGFEQAGKRYSYSFQNTYHIY